MAVITAGTPGNWTDPDSWVDGVVPGIWDQVVIPNTIDIIFDANIGPIGINNSTWCIHIESGGILTVNGDFQLTALGYIWNEGLHAGSGSLLMVEWTPFISGAVNERATWRVELRDTAGVLQKIFSITAKQIEWSYLRKGGQDAATIQIATDFETFNPTDHLFWDFRVLIDTGEGLLCWWRGFVSWPRRTLSGQDLYTIPALGYLHRTERIPFLSLGFDINEGVVIFENMEISEIVKSILDRIAPWVPFSYTAESVPNTGKTIEQISVTGSVPELFQMLAMMAGDYDYGTRVDPPTGDLEFYMLPKSSTDGHIFIAGKDIANFEESSNGMEMINRLVILGGEDFRAVIEDSSDMAVDQQQTGSPGFIAFGKTTSHQMVTQSFTPQFGTLSEIEIKLTQVGFGTTNMVSDGDMEAGGTGSWTNLTDRTLADKDTTRVGEGTQSLKIYHNRSGRGRYGKYQNISVSSGTQYNISAKITPPRWESGVYIEIIDGDASFSANNPILESSFVTSSLGGWITRTRTVIPTGTTLGIRFFSDNEARRSGNDPFWIDLVHCFEADDVIVSIVNDPANAQNNETVIAEAVVLWRDISTSVSSASTHRIKMLVSPIVVGNSYGIRLSRTGSLSDTTYFRASYSPTASYTGGSVKEWDGTTWNLILADSDLYFKTFLPTSQKTYGILGDVIVNPLIRDVDTATIWGEAVLADRASPQKQAMLQLSPKWVRMLEAATPLVRGRVQNLMTSGLSIERINYALDAGGNFGISLEMGQKKPAIVDELAWIEHKLSLLAGR